MKKKHNDPVNHERWLVSYADFITLLFAFFVIMYAISQADIAKFKQVSKSLRAAFNTDGGPSGAIDQSGASGGKTANPFENPETPGGRAMDMPGGKANAASESDSELHDIRDLLEETVSLELGATDLSDKMLMVYDSQGLVIRLAAKDFFDEGSSEVKGDLRPLLDRIGQVVTSSKKSIRIEGHADPSEAHVKNTWTLSTERAAWVAKYWISRFNVDPKRIGIAGYGHFRPLSQSQSNKDSVWSRASNRRVEIIILKNQYPE